MTKSNTVQNGKGSSVRKGANFKAYWTSDLWDNLKHKRSETEDRKKEENRDRESSKTV